MDTNDEINWKIIVTYSLLFSLIGASVILIIKLQYNLKRKQNKEFELYSNLNI